MPSFLLIAVLLWVVSMLIWWGVSTAFRHADVDKIKNRLAGSQAVKKEKGVVKATPLMQQEDTTKGKFVMGLLHRLRLRDRLQTLLEQSGLRWNVPRLIHGCLAMFLLGFSVAWIVAPPFYQKFAVIAGLAMGCLPLLYVIRQRNSRLNKFEELFPESLEFVSRSMRAGHAFSVSLEMIHREFQEPLAGEFRRTFEEHNLGLPLEVALQKLARRVPSLDVHFFVSAVLLQKRTGGNLAEILDKLAYIIRERFKLRGRIRAISAHGRMTGMALTCIPIAVGTIMFYVNKDYVTFFFNDETGPIMMGCASGLQLIGYGVIKKIVSIEV